MLGSASWKMSNFNIILMNLEELNSFLFCSPKKMNHSSAPFFVCSPMLTHCSIGSFPPPTNVFSGFYLYFILEANWKCKKAYVHIPCKVHRQLKRNHFICDGCVTMAVYTLQQQQCDTMQSYMLLSTNSWIVCICASSHRSIYLHATSEFSRTTVAHSQRICMWKFTRVLHSL